MPTPIPITDVLPLPEIPGTQMDLDTELGLLRSALAAAAMAGNTPATARALETIASLETANLKLKILAGDTLPKSTIYALADRIIELVGQHIDTTKMKEEVYERIRDARNRDEDRLDTT